MTAAARRASEVEERERYLGECLDIHPEDLNHEFVKVPAEIAFWNARYAEATFAHEEAKLNYDRERARLVMMLRQNVEAATKRPPPEYAIDAHCDNDEDLYHLKLDAITKDAERVRLRGIVDAITSKRDMLQSLGAKLREEMRGDPSVRQPRPAERALVGE